MSALVCDSAEISPLFLFHFFVGNETENILQENTHTSKACIIHAEAAVLETFRYNVIITTAGWFSGAFSWKLSAFFLDVGFEAVSKDIETKMHFQRRRNFVNKISRDNEIYILYRQWKLWKCEILIGVGFPMNMIFFTFFIEFKISINEQRNW